jgi:hypothetical protein
MSWYASRSVRTSPAVVAAFEQLRADGHEPVEEVGVQRLEAGAVAAERGREPVLGDEQVDEDVDPGDQPVVRRGQLLEQCRAGVRARLHLVSVDGDDQVGPGGEVAVDRADAHPGRGRDVAHRGVDAGGDEDRRSGVEQGGPVALGVSPTAWGRTGRCVVHARLPRQAEHCSVT